MKLKALAIFSALTGFTAIAFGMPQGRSDLYGHKWPNSPDEGIDPVPAYAESVDSYTGFTDLIPYALAAPDQQDAGSCLYMSLTGIAEWWLARLNPGASRAHDGPLDLSERYLMNLAGIEERDNGVKNWKTDSVYLFNKKGGSVLNKNYRFTMGWHVTDSKGNVVAATAKTKGAQYSTSYNWIDASQSVQNGFVSLPKFERDIVFADPDSDQWNVAVMPDTIVDTVKSRLQTRRAPVQVIYNHFGYWHAVNILGFDDSMDTNGCQFVTKFESYMPGEAQKYRDAAEKSTSATERDSLLKKAAKFERIGKKFSDAYHAGGGCNARGMFYVRDSIYPDQNLPYDYDLRHAGTEGYYSKTIVVHEYAWLKYMANHVTQIYVK